MTIHLMKFYIAGSSSSHVETWCNRTLSTPMDGPSAVDPDVTDCKDCRQQWLTSKLEHPDDRIKNTVA